MADKSINPDDPNHDAGLSTLYHSLRDAFPAIQLEEQDDPDGYIEDDEIDGDGDNDHPSDELTDRDFRDL